MKNTDWNSIVCPDFGFGDQPKITRETEKTKDEPMSLSKTEKPFYTSPFFFSTNEIEQMKNAQFKRYETEEEIDRNWKSYREEMTLSYKKKRKQADRSLKRMKRFRRG